MNIIKVLFSKMQRHIFLVGILSFVALDVIFFANCVIPGDNQPPEIMEKGNSQLGVGGQTFLGIFPVEAAGYYRYGLGNNKDMGIRIHNFLDMIGALADFRTKTNDNGDIFKLGFGYYTSDAEFQHQALYLAPSYLFRSNKVSYWGIKLNSYLFPKQNRLYALSYEDEIGTSWALGPTLTTGLQVGQKLKFYAGTELGAVYHNKPDVFWPIIQAEMGLGYAF